MSVRVLLWMSRRAELEQETSTIREKTVRLSDLQYHFTLKVSVVFAVSTSIIVPPVDRS